jgi:hypothetical protein
MNLQVSPAALVEAPVPPADDAVALALNAAKLSSESALLDAVESRRVQLGLSFKTLDLVAGLAVGHSSKLMSPARIKSPSATTLFSLLDALALSIVLVNDPAKAARISPLWKRRDRRMSGIGRCRESRATARRSWLALPRSSGSAR